MINLDVWSILLGFGVLNGFFLTMILWFTKKGSSQSNRILSALLFCISIFTLELIIYRSGHYYQNPQYSLFSFPFAYCIAPLFFFYARSLVSGENNFKITDLVHLSFPVMALVALVPYYLWENGAKIDYMMRFHEPASLTFRHLWLGGIFLVQSFLYFGLTYFFLKNYQRRYKSGSSGTQIHYLEWINKLMITFLVFILVNAIISSFYVIAQFTGTPNVGRILFPSEEVNMIILTFFAHLVGYHAINHPARLFPEPITEPKYARSTLSKKQRLDYLQSIQKQMEEDQLYLNPNLNLSTLAELTGLSTDQLSQVINQELAVNFYEFVNEYRVKEAQMKLIDPQYSNLSILGIALESGFNSKSSFNRIFKKYVGVTPSEYLSRHS